VIHGPGKVAFQQVKPGRGWGWWASGVMSLGGGDVGPAGESEHLGAVLVEGDVADPMEPVLDAPVSLDPGGQGRR